MRVRLPVVLLSAVLAVPIALAVPRPSSAAPSPAAVVPRIQQLPVTDDAAARAVARSVRTVGAPTPLLLSAPMTTRPYAMVGAKWFGSVGNTTVELRTRHAGRWSAWTALSADDTGADSGSSDDVSARSVRAGDMVSEPVFAGPSDGVQTRVVGTGRIPADLQLVLVDPGSSAADAAVATPTSRSANTVGQPTIHTRADWGADESLRARNPGCGTPAYSSVVKMGFVHHTDSPNDYTAAQVPSIIRGIYAYHVLSGGYCDIAYNFLVDKFGGIWEGRYGGITKPVLGAHTGGFNTDTFGVAMIGTYSTVAPTSATVSALQRLFAWRLGIAYRNPSGTATLVAAPFPGSKYAAGTSVTFNAVSGHRDADFTDCPGGAGYNILGAVRAGARSLLGIGLISPSSFSTDEVTQVHSGVLLKQNWTLTVTDQRTDAVVRKYSGTTASAIDVAWDHRDSHGAVVPDGTYRLNLTSSAGPPTAIPWSALVTLPHVNTFLPVPARLTTGDELFSPKGQYRLVVQADGNVVVYGNGRALWATRTQNHAGVKLIMQGDGNAVLYSASNAILWSSHTSGAGDTARLLLQDDGALRVRSDYGDEWTNGALGADSLTAGGTLTAGQYLHAPRNQYRLAMQTDGNLVVYGNGRALWSTKTVGNPGASLTVQSGGDVVVQSRTGNTLWSSATGGRSNALLRIRDNGDLQITSGTTLLWHNGAPGSTTLFSPGQLTQIQYLHSPSGRYSLDLQSDGNLVVYGRGRALWSANTRGVGVRLVLQGDGNLVIYNGDGALWSTRTAGTGNASRLVMQEDGNLVLYSARGVAWATGTNL